MKKIKRSLFLLLSIMLLFTGCKHEQVFEESKGSISGKANYSNFNSSESISISLLKDDRIIASSECKEDGSYNFKDLDFGEYVIYASSNSSTEKTVQSSVIKINSSVNQNVDTLILTATGTLSGTVRLDNSQDNNTGFTVYIGGTSFSAKTGKNGKFIISDIPAGSGYEVFVEKGYFTSLWKTTDVTALSDKSLGEISFTSEEVWNIPSNSDLRFYSINYELNGGILNEDSPIYHIYGINTTLGTPTREGYSFVGWYMSPEFQGKPITKLSAKSIEQDITLYAFWTTKLATTASELNAKLANSSSEADILIIDEYPDFSVLVAAINGNKNVNVKLDLTMCNLSSIPNGIFNSLTNLIEIELPKSVQNISANAFQSCTRLTKVKGLDNVVSIGANAFDGCSYLSEVTLSENLKTIGSYAFNGCSTLSDSSFTTNLESIGSYAFSKTKITSLTIPEGIEYVPTGLCSGCSALKTVVLPDSVTDIGDSVFDSCGKLDTINIPSAVTYLGSSIFKNCSSLKNITLPNGISTIPSYTFYGTGITEFEIQEGIKRVEDYAFANCTSLTTVTISPTVSYFGVYCFNGDSSITRVNISDLKAWCNITFNYDGNRANYTNPTQYSKSLYLCGEKLSSHLIIPDGTTIIQQYAFYYCEDIDSVTIPPSVKKIGSGDVYSCNFRNVNKLYITDLAAWCECVGTPLHTTGGHIYLNGTELTSVTIPEGVTKVGQSSFAYCSNIKSVTFSSTCDEIGRHAFYDCTSLTNFTIPSSVNAIGPAAFLGCTNLTQVTFQGNNTWVWGGDTREKTYNKTSTIDVTNKSEIAQKLNGTYTYSSNISHLVNYWMVRK